MLKYFADSAKSGNFALAFEKERHRDGGFGV